MLFNEIIGQAVIKKRLIQTVKDNRISHAQLLLSTEGSGGLALALAYAQYISCTDKSEVDACGNCPSCIKCAKLIHPDIHFIYPLAISKDVRESTDVVEKWRKAFLTNPYLSLRDWFEYLDAENKQAIIGSEESAAILRKLSLTTYESEFKIMIIWLPEKMNTTAANKILKILEEPTDKTLFILVTENADQLLQTIISRTQLIKIPKITNEDLSQAIQKNYSLSPEETQRIVRLSEGNYNTALQLINNDESATNNYAIFQTWMRACLKFDALKVLTWIDELAVTGREQQKNFLIYALHIIRECLLLNYADTNLTRLDGEELLFVKKFSLFIHSANCEQFVEELNAAHQQIERNANPKILFLDLSFKINEFLNIKK